MIILLIFVAALLLHLIPFMRKARHTGVDHWYWLAYLRAVKSQKKFPPNLPNYLLEKEQWYPPIFPLFLSIFPFSFLEKYGASIPIFFNLLRLALLFFVCRFLQIDDPWIVGLVGLAYITAPILSSYNIQLNPRGMAALFMDLTLVLLLMATSKESSIVLWVGFVFFSSAILLTHKMTTQLFIFLCFFCGLLYKNWIFFGYPFVLIPLTIVLSLGFYFKVLKGHWGIIKLWSREWPLLGANPLKESPLYGEKNYKSPSRQYEPGLKSFFKRLLSIPLGMYAPIVTGGLILSFLVPLAGEEYQLIGFWLMASYLFTFITIFIPFLRGLGHGNLYLYNSIFPACLIIGYACSIHPKIGLPISLLFIFFNVVALVRSLNYSKKSLGYQLPPEIFSEIRKCEKGSWLCLPMPLMEHVSYLADKPVIWGGHGSGFENINQIIPVIRKDVKELKTKYNLRYLLVDDFHLDAIQKTSIQNKIIFSKEGYSILELSE